MKRRRWLTILNVGLLVGLMLMPAGVHAQKKLTVWGYDLRATKDIAPQVEKFEALHPDVKIETVNMPSHDMEKKLMMALYAGTGAPDVSYEMDTAARKYYGTDLIYPLDDVITYEGIFPNALRSAYIYEGKIWMAPNDLGPFCIYYRQDIFDEVGVDFPKSWQEFIEIGKKVTIPNKRFMTVFQSDLAEQLTSIVQSRGGKITNVDNAVLFNNSIVAEVCQYIDDAVNKYKIADYAIMWDAAAWTKIKEGRWATIPAWFWYGGFLKEFAYKPELEGKWRIARPLPWTRDDPPTGATYSGVGGWLVTRQTKYPDLAKEFVALLVSKDAQVSLAKRRGVPPANMEALEVLSKWEDPFFGGQKPYKIMLEEMKDCPPAEYGDKYYGAIRAVLNKMLNKIVQEGTPVKKALEEAEKSAKIELRE